MHKLNNHHFFVRFSNRTTNSKTKGIIYSCYKLFRKICVSQGVVFSIICCSIIISCKYEEETNVTEETNWGYVKEYYTEKPIKGAMVIVSGANPMWGVQDTLYTDENGRYEFEPVKYFAYVQANAENYISPRQYSQVEVKGILNRVIHLYQPAEMVIRVRNVTNTSDNNEVGLTDFIPSKYLSGENLDTLVCCLLARRYTPVTISVWVYEKGKSIPKHVKAFPTKDKDNIVEVFY